MGEWSGQGIWWCCDLSIVLSSFYESFSYTRGSKTVEENILNPVVPSVDSAISSITWCLEKEPEMAFIALDSGNSKRKEIFPEYKAFRSRPPEYHAAYDGILRDLRDNFQDVLQVVAADGWESDDVMASIANEAVKQGKKCIMMSSDKDMRQCLKSGHVKLQIRGRDGLGHPDWKDFLAGDAETSWGGLKVEQFIDYQILLGDDVDNIPGAPGIGKVTAVKLLKRYGSIEKMKESDIPGKTGECLKEFWKSEQMIRQLITLNDKLFYDMINVNL